MISFLRGKIVELGKGFMILDVNGVGYRLRMPVKALDILAKNDGKTETKVYTQMHFNQREGSSELYGFVKKDDLEAFNLLTSISGIGPKNAMHMLSSMEIRELVAAVSKEDAEYLRKISGLGPKTAKRLVNELKDKIDNAVFAQFAKVDLSQESEAMDALISLGYPKNLTLEALKKKKKKNISVESKVKEALKILSGS